MKNQLCEMLHLDKEPVGIFFANESAQCDLDANPEKRNCVIPLLLASSNGKTISLNEESCNCPGGAVGCCFGNGFERLNPNIHKMLSQGFGENAPAKVPPKFKDGERFYCSEELAIKWKESLPYSDKAYPRIVFAPLSRWEEIGTPDLVFCFTKPDHISALIAMLGSHNGKAINTICPQCAACQSIMFAADQCDKEEPMAVMGLFDISQRRAAIKDYLSMTMPYSVWENLHQDLDKSCLTTHSWHEIEKRL